MDLLYLSILKQFSENEYEDILFHHSSNGTYVFQIAEDNNYVRFGIKESNESVWTFIQGILNYEWTNITGVYNSSINKIEIYIDGYLADEDYIQTFKFIIFRPCSSLCSSWNGFFKVEVVP